MTDVRAVLEPFDAARPLPPLAYRDASVLAFEREAIFGRRWIAVAHEDELSRPGDRLVAPVTPEGVIVTRGEDLALHAFYNVCPHRGATLLDGDCPPRGEGRIECPYHGLAFALDGAPLTTLKTNRGEAFGGLAPVRVATYRGLVFVCLDSAAPDIESALAGAPAWLAELPPLRRARRVRWETRANWKLVIENFQESHHFPGVHAALEALTPASRSSSVIGDGLWLGGTMDLAGEAETVSLSGKLDGRPRIAPEGARGRVLDALLFPNLLLSLQPDYLLSYRLFPRDVDRTEIVADIHVADACPESADLAGVFGIWDRINAEDRAVCERQQVGVGSRAFSPVAYAASEDGVHAFDRLVARAYEAAFADEEAKEEEDDEDDSPPPPPPRSRLWGIWGHPYLDLSTDLDTSSFPRLDEEIATALARAETSSTGGSLKWMNVVAPWVHDDPYRDYGEIISRFSREEFLRFVALAEDPGAFDPDRQHEYRFGDETDHPLTQEQIRYLIFRHGVYFPWRICYHLVENKRWDDKHSGAGKDFTEEARELFPETVAFIQSLPFTEIGRAVIFGLEANHHAPLHRDTEPGAALSVAQSISFSPRGDKRLYLVDPEGGSRTIVKAPIYWFNDMDYHGVLPDPYFRYSVRVDGVFEPAFARALARKYGGRAARGRSGR